VTRFLIKQNPHGRCIVSPVGAASTEFDIFNVTIETRRKRKSPTNIRIKTGIIRCDPDIETIFTGSA
jgi:hypothetical protein